MSPVSTKVRKSKKRVAWPSPEPSSNIYISLYELQQTVDRVAKLSHALRAAGLQVEVTSHISLSFEVRLEDPKKIKLSPES